MSPVFPPEYTHIYTRHTYEVLFLPRACPRCPHTISDTDACGRVCFMFHVCRHVASFSAKPTGASLAYLFLFLFSPFFSLRTCAHILLVLDAKVNVVLRHHRAVVKVEEDIIRRQLTTRPRNRKARHSARLEFRLAAWTRQIGFVDGRAALVTVESFESTFWSIESVSTHSRTACTQPVSICTFVPVKQVN